MPPPHRRHPRIRVLLLSALLAGILPAADAMAGAAAPGDGQAEAGASARAAAASLHGTLANVVRLTQARGRGPFGARPLYREPGGPAQAQADAWRAERPDDAALIDRIAGAPAALWLGDWTRDVRAAAADRVADARAAGALPVLVAYNIPDRDCGQHSSGGAAGPAAYRDWIDDLAAGLGAGPAAVVLEPDALAALDCLGAEGRSQRTALVAYAAARLSRQPGVAVYLDAGHATWVAPAEMARRLRAGGVARARGFAVNVANFHTTARSRAYGAAVSRRVGGAPFVIDTGRNGAGPAPGDAWCNPPGRALGDPPGAQPDDPLVDALLWVKRPGESDGTCNGGPPAGTWWPEEALRLARGAA